MCQPRSASCERTDPCGPWAPTRGSWAPTKKGSQKMHVRSVEWNWQNRAHPDQPIPALEPPEQRVPLHQQQPAQEVPCYRSCSSREKLSGKSDTRKNPASGFRFPPRCAGEKPQLLSAPVITKMIRSHPPCAGDPAGQVQCKSNRTQTDLNLCHLRTVWALRGRCRSCSSLQRKGNRSDIVIKIMKH